MPNQLIFITANEADYQSNATTDEHGLVQFSINTTKITGNSLTVRVSLERPRLEVSWKTKLQPKRGDISKLRFVPWRYNTRN
jgi:hypothetical protein